MIHFLAVFSNQAGYTAYVVHVLEHVSLKLYSTMRLGGFARFVCDVTNEDELLEVLAFAKGHGVPHRVIGSGSNIIWRDEGYDGLLIVNKIDGFETHDDGLTITIGAGMKWDDAVARTVEMGLSGIEFLSLIPGTAGATPVQNVGAYGREIKDVFVRLRAYDTQDETFVTLDREACSFKYRSSRFKAEDNGRYVITAITLKLNRDSPQPPFYDALQTYLDVQHITDYSPASIRDAVIAIRSSKLPDPAKVANNGSFFANPVIQTPRFEKLQSRYIDAKGWPYQDGVKVAAGWLVEKAGFSDFHDEETGMATWSKQNLVLVNEHARSTEDLLKFKQKIVSAVKEKFGITLEQEPEILP